MNKTLLSLTACAAMAAISIPTLAADEASKHDQMMKHCMAKHDSSMSKEDAMKKCSDEMSKSKMKKHHMEKEPGANPAPDQ
jgi:pentapeptide MXKDX repeat protein